MTDRGEGVCQPGQRPGRAAGLRGRTSVRGEPLASEAGPASGASRWPQMPSRKKAAAQKPQLARTSAPIPSTAQRSLALRSHPPPPSRLRPKSSRTCTTDFTTRPGVGRPSPALSVRLPQPRSAARGVHRSRAARPVAPLFAELGRRRRRRPAMNGGHWRLREATTPLETACKGR